MQINERDEQAYQEYLNDLEGIAHFRTYTDANGIPHASYDDACEYYGADMPAQIAAEIAAEEREWQAENMDRMEAGVIQPGAMWVYQPDYSAVPF